MSGLQKNVASQHMKFGLVNAATGAALTGATITAYYAQDSGTQSTTGGTVTELGHGQYDYAPTQAETNAVDVGFFFSAASAIPVNYDFHTDVVDASGNPIVAPNWASIQNPTASVNLSSTTISTGQTIASAASITGSVGSVVGSVGGSVAGSVGSVVGSVAGSVAGSVGSVTGSVAGSVAGSVGSVVGSVAGSVAGSVGSVVGSVGGSVAGSVGSVIGNVGGSLTGSVGNVLAIGGSATAATQIGLSGQKIGNGTVGTGSTTTSIVTSALNPANTAAGQFQGRIVIFDIGTTTTNLRGQATAISTDSGSGTLTVTALTTAPVSGDTFTIT